MARTAALATAALLVALGIGLAVAATVSAQPPLPAPPTPPAPVSAAPSLPFTSIPGLGPISPPPAPGPSAPPPASALLPLAQTGIPSPILGGLPALPDLSGRTANEFVLGQHAAPAAPGAAPATPIHLNPYNNAYLLPQNLVPSAPGQGELFGIPPGQENADINGIEYLKRLYDTYRAGGLEGGLLGQRELDSLNKPLPVEPPALPPPPAPNP